MFFSFGILVCCPTCCIISIVPNLSWKAKPETAILLTICMKVTFVDGKKSGNPLVRYSHHAGYVHIQGFNKKTWQLLVLHKFCWWWLDSTNLVVKGSCLWYEMCGYVWYPTVGEQKILHRCGKYPMNISVSIFTTCAGISASTFFSEIHRTKWEWRSSTASGLKNSMEEYIINIIISPCFFLGINGTTNGSFSWWTKLLNHNPRCTMDVQLLGSACPNFQEQALISYVRVGQTWSNHVKSHIFNQMHHMKNDPTRNHARKVRFDCVIGGNSQAPTKPLSNQISGAFKRPLP